MLFRRTSLLMLLSISFSINASIVKLGKEFLDVNANIKSENLGSMLLKLDIDSLKASKDWNLSYSYLKDDNKLATSIATASNLETTTNSLTLTKDFGFGGSLSFSNSLNSFSGNPETYSFSQEISYTQSLGKDFFGRSFYKKVEAAKIGYESGKFQSDANIHALILAFVQNVSNAKLYKSLVDLQEQAKVRAEKRLDLINKRVRDGLREKVDSFQAQTSLLSQIEQVQSAKISLNSQLEKVSEQLHRNVGAKEIEAFQKPSNILRADMRSGLDNPKLKSLAEKEKYQQNLLEQKELNYIPTVSLTTALKNNDYNSTSSDAISNGKLGGDHKEAKFLLSVSWPLGLETERVEKAKSYLSFKNSQYQKEKLTKSQQLTFEKVKERILLLEQNIKSAEQRKKLAAKTLGEYNKLYSKGRADLDQVIRAEETLISTEISSVQYMAQLEQINFALALLQGKILDFFN